MFLFADLQAILKRDPAARNWLEILLCYPGLHALLIHHLAHALYRLKIPLLPRLISHINRFLTGIEIHPGAQMGKGVFIDHGMGIVIGETAIVGDGTVIYQGVTLGGTGKETGKRHPTLGKNVVVGAGAKVLGNIQIGDNVRIGAASVVLRSVPENCTVVGIPGRITHHRSTSTDALAQDNLRDMQAEVIGVLFERVKRLEQQIEQFHSQSTGRPGASTSNGSVSNLARAGHFKSTESFKLDKLERDRLIEEFLDGSGI
jgi:serine O-acetyltransferase